MSVFRVVALSCFLAGCSSSDLTTMGKLGVPSMARVSENLILVDTTVNGHPGGRLLADTGSPFTLVDPSAFPGATLPPQSEVDIDLGFGVLTVDGVPAIQVMGETGSPLAGIVGGNVMRQFSTTFDYRDQQLRFGAGNDPSDVEQPGAEVAFELQGGGKSRFGSQTISYPATRIPVTVTLDGIDHAFLLDTGASEVIVRTSLFAVLVSDGRDVLDGILIGTIDGVSTARATRARSITVGGERVTSPVVLGNADDLLDGIGNEMGHTIDGLLGGTFLREFLVTIDYPHGALHLRRYATRDHIIDEFKCVGIAYKARTTNGYTVGVVFPGTDAAAKGITTGDELVSVDGQALAAIDPLAAQEMLCGTVGTTHTLGFGSASSATLANRTSAVRIDDLIPAP